MFQAKWIHNRAVTTLFAICCATGLFFYLEQEGLLESFDNVLKTLRYELASKSPSGDVVLVEIDSQSLLELDSWPWPRRYHAQVLDNLMDLGADVVAFDVDFSSTSNAEDDLSLASALERAGGYAYTAAFDRNSTITNQILRSEPLEIFSQQADPVLVNVFLDREGRASTFPAYSGGTLPRIFSLATTLGKPKTVPPPLIHFDYRIDIGQVDRISYADALRGDVDAARVQGKQIVIGASAFELRDFFETPRFGIIPGPLLQILALETVKNGYYITDAGPWPGIVWIVLMTALGTIVSIYIGRFNIIYVGIFGLIGSEIGALLLFNVFHIEVSTSIVLFVVPLSVAIEVMTASAMWFKQRQAMQKRLEYLAMYDEVTGVYSYPGFVQTVGSRAKNSAELTMMILSIQRLNIVRGALGKGVADETLRKIAERLQALCANPIGKVTQNEFAIAFDKKLDGSQLEEMTADALHKVCEPYSVNGHTILIEVQAAVAKQDDPTEGIEATLNNARIALDAKAAEQTKNHTIKLYSPNLGVEISDRQRMDIKMRDAIQNDEFRLAYQPQIDLKTGELIGVEALIRWHSPEGIISPVQFIDLAEETGFVVQLGTWVIEEACRITSEWGWSGVLSVNVSPLQLELSDVPAITKQALKRFKYPAERFCIEITESVLMTKGEEALDTLRALQKLGCTIAIDDFGTGYSSLSYLTQLPFDKLKIDQSFVRGMESNRDNQTIVETMVGLSHKLGKSVIAEGVETKGEAQLLRDMDCEVGQGYYFARPVDARTLTKIIMAAQRVKVAS